MGTHSEAELYGSRAAVTAKLDALGAASEGREHRHQEGLESLAECPSTG